MSPVRPVFPTPLPLSRLSPRHLILTLILSSPQCTGHPFHSTELWWPPSDSPLILGSYMKTCNDYLFHHIKSSLFFDLVFNTFQSLASSYLADFLMLLCASSPLLWSSQCPWESHIHHYLEVTCSFLLLAISFFSIWLNLAYSSWPTSSIKSYVPPSLIPPAHTDLLCL